MVPARIPIRSFDLHNRWCRELGSAPAMFFCKIHDFAGHARCDLVSSYVTVGYTDVNSMKT